LSSVDEYEAVKVYIYRIKGGVYIQDQGSRIDVEDAADMSFALAV
jgi:hypothetical protein